MKQPKYTIGLKFKGKPYSTYSEVHVNTLNQRIFFPQCIKGVQIATAVIINKKAYKFSHPVWIINGTTVGFRKGELYKVLKSKA